MVVINQASVTNAAGGINKKPRRGSCAGIVFEKIIPCSDLNTSCLRAINSQPHLICRRVGLIANN